MRDKDGETRRERNESFEIESPEVDVPAAGETLWNWFWAIRRGIAPGFSGVAPISSLELVAWLQLTGNILRREEIDILTAMDARYCDEINKETEAIRDREAE